MLWPFLRARASQLVYSSLSSFFAWCRAKVCRSGSKDICTLQKAEENYRGEPHEILVKCFRNFVYPWFARIKKTDKFRTAFQNILFITQFMNCFITARGKSKIETTGLSVK